MGSIMSFGMFVKTKWIRYLEYVCDQREASTASSASLCFSLEVGQSNDTCFHALANCTLCDILRTHMICEIAAAQKGEYLRGSYKPVYHHQGQRRHPRL